MKQVILLATAWGSDYWDSDKEAPYPGRKYTDLPGWEELSKNCPLAGLGIYIKQKDKDYFAQSFVYLKINGMRYDTDSDTPFFSFKVIKKATASSKSLVDKLPSEARKLFWAMNADDLIKILSEIGETPPKEWLALLGSVRTSACWRDYIGTYFLDLQSETLSNDEFEDRVAHLLTALGFDVTQKGHKIKGEYADGIATFDENECAIVYDCKNTVDFVPTAESVRALEKYFEDEKKVHRGKSLYKAFIAKSFTGGQRATFFLPVDSLLYLLYKKLTMGSKFTLSPLRKILDSDISLTTEMIDKEWWE
jgi:hypothetical protein